MQTSRVHTKMRYLVSIFVQIYLSDDFGDKGEDDALNQDILVHKDEFLPTYSYIHLHVYTLLT